MVMVLRLHQLTATGSQSRAVQCQRGQAGPFLHACEVPRAEKLLCDASADLGVAPKGWALADEPVTPAANLALFSSFSNILFIPPFKKYSWQTLQRADERGGGRMSQAPESPAEGAAAGRQAGRKESYLRHHSMRPSPSHFLVQWWSARFFMARAYSLSVRSSSQCSRQIFSKSPTLKRKQKGRDGKRTLSIYRTISIVSPPSDPKLQQHFYLGCHTSAREEEVKPLL